jgi:biotin carboxylase
VVPPFYDSMIGKLIVRGVDRADALRRAAVALARFRVEGIESNLTFQAALVGHADFAANRFNTRWLEQVFLPAFNAGRG